MPHGGVVLRATAWDPGEDLDINTRSRDTRDYVKDLSLHYSITAAFIIHLNLEEGVGKTCEMSATDWAEVGLFLWWWCGLGVGGAGGKADVCSWQRPLRTIPPLGIN